MQDNLLFSEREFFFTHVEQVLKIKEKTLKAIHRLGIFSLRDLLFYKPVGFDAYQDNINLDAKAEALVQIPVVIKSSLKTGRYICIKTDFQGIEIDLIFFSTIPIFIKSILKLGTKIFIMGKIKYDFTRYQIIHPEFLLNKKLLRPIIPKYSLTYGLNNTQLYNYILTSLDHVKSKILGEFLNLDLKKYYIWLYKTLKKIHFDDLSLKSKDAIAEQKNALLKISLEELFVHQFSLKNFYLKKEISSYKKAILPNKKLQAIILEKLHFSLTKDQRSAIFDIESDQQDSIPMMRLLQGDVGSGKTLVAMLTILNAVSSKEIAQAALIAPTDILSHQHYQFFLFALKETSIRVDIITGSTSKKCKELLKKDLKQGKISILIGTHSLFQKDIVFHNLVYVVIDEQHRFGVKQRLLLIEKAKIADVLIMSATPIPRSLTLALFGNISISKLYGVASGNRDVSTYVISNTKRLNVIQKIQNKIEKGHKSFWICPFIEQVQDNEYLSYITNVKDRYIEISRYYPNKVGIVHGSMKKSEQDLVLQKFSQGEFLILVSTTVIEVGIDIKLSSLMVIENAERFGLSQLHQLRGRIGRDGTRSECILLYDKKFFSQNAKERLEVMKNTNDGFLIAQKDLEIRGHGEIMGLKQSGQIKFFFADLEQNYFLIEISDKKARKEDISTINDFKIQLFTNQEGKYIKSF